MRKAKNTINLTEINIEEAVEYFGVRVIPHTIDDGYTVINDYTGENWRASKIEVGNMLMAVGMKYAVMQYRGEIATKGD